MGRTPSLPWLCPAVQGSSGACELPVPISSDQPFLVCIWDPAPPPREALRTSPERSGSPKFVTRALCRPLLVPCCLPATAEAAWPRPTPPYTVPMTKRGTAGQAVDRAPAYQRPAAAGGLGSRLGWQAFSLQLPALIPNLGLTSLPCLQRCETLLFCPGNKVVRPACSFSKAASLGV